jgi:hypothetical protein
LNEDRGTLSGLAVAALTAPLRFYRRFLSPLFPPACRFEPSCSRYAIEAIETHGALKGTGLALRRLSRCHPISWLGGSSGFDPVPPR